MSNRTITSPNFAIVAAHPSFANWSSQFEVALEEIAHLDQITFTNIRAAAATLRGLALENVIDTMDERDDADIDALDLDTLLNSNLLCVLDDWQHHLDAGDWSQKLVEFETSMDYDTDHTTGLVGSFSVKTTDFALLRGLEVLTRIHQKGARLGDKAAAARSLLNLLACSLHDEDEGEAEQLHSAISKAYEAAQATSQRI